MCQARVRPWRGGRPQVPQGPWCHGFGKPPWLWCGRQACAGGTGQRFQSQACSQGRAELASTQAAACGGASPVLGCRVEHWLQADAPGKAAEDGPGAWAWPRTWNRMAFLDPGHTGLMQASGEQTSAWKLCLYFNYSGQAHESFVQTCSRRHHSYAGAAVSSVVPLRRCVQRHHAGTPCTSEDGG